MKTKINKIVLCILVISTLISAFAISASALSWDGSSSGGTGAGSPAGPNGYAIRTTGDNCLGYRFSVVDKSGNTKGGKSIDVFRNTSYGNMEFSGAYKFDNKQNKMQIINNQNNGFSSSKSTWRCIKETSMGFASGLPKPEGMNSWQSNHNNLNRILSELGIGSVNNLKNGDKILVEPLFDIRLQGTYHSITVTEMALYGKWLLGANSNGGSSSTSASWGFISGYTNKIYPNTLYTPNGQGLWSGVGALGGSGTFYNIINGGYGVGIAYTETRPDFTPNLTVNKCEVWPGNTGNRNSHYGISNGSSFGNYSYGNGYPIKGDKIWYAVNFPAESENCYVRQTVWVDGGGSTSRNVYSHSGTWYDVSLSPTVVDAGRSYYYVKARVDWIDGNGNVLKWGAEKTFYIPIRPKINRQQVTLTDITGKTSAYGGSGGYSGNVYVGQKVYPQYTYTSENSWTSYNNFTGNLYEWKNGEWKSRSDMTANGVGINQNGAYNKFSSLYPYRVVDNSANTNGGNRIPFYLTSTWTTDTDRTYQTTWIDIPIVKADVELEEIKLIDESGNYITGQNVWANQLVTPQYIYRNNTNCTVYVEGYNNDGTQIAGIYAIPANGQIAVNGKQIRVSSYGTFYVWGGVYLEGAGKGNTNWEKEDFDSQNNNHWLRYWSIQNPLTIEAIAPNSNYREGVQVMTSFKIYNASPTAFIPNDAVTVHFSVYNGYNQVYSTYKYNAVVPGVSNNLVYFKWTVPRNLKGATLSVKGEIIYAGKSKDIDSLDVQSTTVYDSQTADTKYEDKKPSGWSATSAPAPYANSATWSEWIYSDGSFRKVNYGLKLYQTAPLLTPDSNSPSAKQENSIWHMKSGYGYSINWRPTITFVNDRTFPSGSTYTAVQNGYAMFPEYNYSIASNKYRTLQLVSGNFQFKSNSASNGARNHFIPVWYPNGNYVVSAYAYDCWTPAGMIGVRSNSADMTINGSMYDDYFIGRN